MEHPRTRSDVDHSRRRSNVLLPLLSLVSLLTSAASFLQMAFEFPLPLPALPFPPAVLGGAVAGVAGLVTVVSGALQRQAYIWTVFGIIGMAVGIATGLMIVQAG